MSYKIKLEIFEGPLDLLLHLVKQNEMDIANIPIAQITEQYLQYIHLMETLDLEIAGEFLVMASTLIQIKSRMLLPPEALPPEAAEEPDPREELMRRLLEYQKFKQAAELLSGMEKTRFVQFSRPVSPEGTPVEETDELVEASLFDLLRAFSQFMSGEISRELVHEILREEFTVEEKVSFLRELLLSQTTVSFAEIFSKTKSKLEAVATFLALLELIRLKEILIRQSQLFGEIILLRNTHDVPSSDALPLRGETE